MRKLRACALMLAALLALPSVSAAKKYGGIADKKRVPAKRAKGAAARSSEEGGSHSIRHVARRGETLTSIAARYGVPVTSVHGRGRGRRGAFKAGQVVLVSAARQSDAPQREARAAAFRREFQQQSDLSGRSSVSLLDEGLLAEIDGSAADRPNRLDVAAFSLLGTPYVFGGSSSSGIDCSAFVQRAFKGDDVALPRTAREQFVVGQPVKLSELKRGDLLFFQTYARFPSHVGIYLGGDKMIHASSRERKVTISSFATDYFKARFLGARRVGGMEDASDTRLAELISSDLSELASVK